MHSEIHITGQPILKKELKVIGKPASAEMPAMTMLALLPMSVPMPPKSAPKARDHASASMEIPSTF